jgi:diadenosine tetraphosphate (Ap4A) HIT family hydrolase/TM2 domain-containing membrane protein YozV
VSDPAKVPTAARPGASACIQCRIAAGQEKPSGLAPLRRGPFLVHPRPEVSPLPGWFIVAPARHVEQIDALDAEAVGMLGPLVAEVATALRAETPCEKVYVSVFAEVVPHFHVHVIARPPGLAPENRGPRIFLAEATTDPAEMASLARRVMARLVSRSAPAKVAAALAPAARPSSGSSARPLRAALLSGLVWPGLGQIANGQLAKGIALVVLVLAVAAWLVLRLVSVVTASVPADASSFDIFQAYDLATQIQQQNAGILSGAVLVLLVIWVFGIVDAYWCGRKLGAPPGEAGRMPGAGVG